VRLKIPKLRQYILETAIIERYRRRESSVEEAFEDTTEALWGTRVWPSTVSGLNKKIYGTIEAWRNRPIEGEHPYVGRHRAQARAGESATYRCWSRSG
jgi:transposase-like protein